mmetsp:Transcript_54852/g.169074  ORF Transcript_54852/g.169074 Transcript_54852/m.169074 type:complete len:227 (-) Transcript_54852:1026-1706(-)
MTVSDRPIVAPNKTPPAHVGATGVPVLAPSSGPVVFSLSRRDSNRSERSGPATMNAPIEMAASRLNSGSTKNGSCDTPAMRTAMAKAKPNGMAYTRRRCSDATDIVNTSVASRLSAPWRAHTAAALAETSIERIRYIGSRTTGPSDAMMILRSGETRKSIWKKLKMAKAVRPSITFCACTMRCSEASPSSTRRKLGTTRVKMSVATGGNIASRASGVNRIATIGMK